MLSFVTWCWTEPGYQRRFLPDYVNVLRAMLERHYRLPHRLVCITDNSSGLDPRIEAIPLPARFDDLKSPHGPRFPSCWRRLWNFSADAARLLGPRIVSLDVDVVITNDLVPLFERPESFVGWTDQRDSWANKIAGGIYMLRTGAHTEVWDKFDPATSPQKAHAAGHTGSDQSWISYCLYPPPGSWTAADGVVSSKWIEPFKPLPPDVRIVSTPGERKPWTHELRRQHSWIAEHWTL